LEEDIVMQLIAVLPENPLIAVKNSSVLSVPSSKY